MGGSISMSSYIIQSQEEEIKRIASELHEGVGQTLYSLYTGLQVVANGVDQPELKSTVKEMASILEKTIQEVKFLSVELHPPALTAFGLVPAIKSYAKLFTSTYGIVVEVQMDGTEKLLNEPHSIALFRVCQEALANIAKHADASSAKINFIWNTGTLHIQIDDAGKGFIVEQALNQPAGLAAMKERIELIGGSLNIISTVGKGTSITVTYPIVTI